ncbi:MAG: hypothetical protein JWN72_2871 [Thermoleophilia bacterium]|nr:hypothetical protein [Thermoleophilia bacterium]
MTNARSVFTEAIEEHLALKKQNTLLEAAMPLARYDVGDPLDRYPGGPSRGIDGTVVVADDVETVFNDGVAPASSFDPDSTQMFTGPSPEQAMEAATALEPAFGHGHPFEPLTGMTPMLSLVEDIDEDEGDLDAPVSTVDASAATDVDGGDLLRFPGGVGPRDETVPVSAEQTMLTTSAFDAPQHTTHASDIEFEDAATGEQPVLVIDADEPLASDAPQAHAPRERTARPRFFGLGRKKSKDQQQADGWFTDGPRDFNWD